MRLHTLQPESVVQVLLAGKVFRPDPELCRLHGFVEDDEPLWRAYRWIARELAQQDEPSAADALPVWVWHTSHPGHPRPDLRRHRPVHPGVLLELEIEDDRVLLSDFHAWHAALNGWFLGDESETDLFEAECRRRGCEWNAFWPDADLAARVTASWSRCLDLEWKGWGEEDKTVQGVLWELRPGDLIRYRRYRGWPDRSRSGESHVL